MYLPQSANQSCTITFYICAQVDDHANENTANFGNYLILQAKRGFDCALNMSAPVDGSVSLSGTLKKMGH